MEIIEKKVAPGNGCAVYKKCGGCQLQNLTYEEQLSWKQGLEIRLLGQFGHVEPIIGMEEPLHYRNKVQAAFGRGRSGIISGVYQSSTHRIVPINSCMIENKVADKIIVTIRHMLDSFKLTVYDENTGRGFLRHVLVKRGFATRQVMVVLITGTPAFPRKKDFLTELLRRHPEITTVVQNVNNGFTSLVLGRDSKVLYGDGKIEDVLCGCRFRISPASFYQINPIQAEKLYNIAIDSLALTGSEVVVDAYCGTGTIGIVAAGKAKQVVGVELNGDAVRDAIENARLNGIRNIRFFKADATQFMLDAAENRERVDAVIMDPPRAGSTERFMESVCRLSPSRVAYVSCDPQTLARDLRYFVKNGYRVKRIQPVDMFPHTQHIETAVLLETER